MVKNFNPKIMSITLTEGRTWTDNPAQMSSTWYTNGSSVFKTPLNARRALIIRNAGQRAQVPERWQGYEKEAREKTRGWQWRYIFLGLRFIISTRAEFSSLSRPADLSNSPMGSRCADGLPRIRSMMLWIHYSLVQHNVCTEYVTLELSVQFMTWFNYPL